MIYRNCSNCNFANMPMGGPDCQRCGTSLKNQTSPTTPTWSLRDFPWAEIGMIFVAICAILAAWIVPKTDFFSWIVVLVIFAACVALIASAVRSMRKGKKPATSTPGPAAPSPATSRMTNVSARLSSWWQWVCEQTDTTAFKLGRIPFAGIICILIAVISLRNEWTLLAGLGLPLLAPIALGWKGVFRKIASGLWLAFGCLIYLLILLAP